MMELFSNWNRIGPSLRSARRRLFLFDFDGTLAPIRKHPGSVRLSKETRDLLRALSHRPGTNVGIISGRSLRDIRCRVAVRGLIYSGNHGLELSMKDGNLKRFRSNYQNRKLRRLYRFLKQTFSWMPGVIVEWKQLSLSLHHRLVKADKKRLFFRLLKEAVPIVERQGYQSRAGRKVVEILPSGEVTKGSVVKRLMKRFRSPLTVFVGDDRTDEDAFKALDSSHISVRIGNKKETYARYFLKRQADMLALLERLVEIK